MLDLSNQLCYNKSSRKRKDKNVVERPIMELQIGDIKLGHEIGKKPDCQRFIWTACAADCGEVVWKVLLVKENKPKTTLCRKCAGLLRRGQKRGPAHNRLNLVGQRFTRLVALECVGIQQNSHRESLWRCKCDCGKETVTTGNSLTSGNTKSCGCYHKIRTRQLFSSPIEELSINRILQDYRNKARKKNRIFSLTKEEFTLLIRADCYYCGAKPSNSYATSTGRAILPYQGIDRLDNSKGYIPENCVSCCIICNKMKKATDVTDFVTHVHTISGRHECVSPQVDLYYESPAEFSVL